MTDPDLIGLFIEPLERVGIRYMITGGVAAVIYGDPRFTRDVDVVLELPSADVERLASMFEGGDFLQEEASRGGHFNIIHRATALRADVYVVGLDPFHRWALERRRRIETEPTPIWVAPIEYVIVRKLEYFRQSGSDRHLRDVAMMLRVSGNQVDRQELERWVATLDLGDVLVQARAYPTS